MLQGECHGTLSTKCSDCGLMLYLSVLETCSPYLGFFCGTCGPYSRETDYFKTRAEAEAALECWKAGEQRGKR